MALEIEKVNVPLKTVIAIVIYISSLVGVYYAMKFKVDSNQTEVIELKEKLKKYNPEIMDYKLNELRVEVTKLNEKADKIYNQIVTKSNDK